MPINSFLGLPETATAAADTVQLHDKVFGLIDTVKGMTTEELISSILSSVIGFGGKILLALLVYIVGRWVIRRICRILNRVFEMRKTDVSLARFVISIIKISLSMILIFIVIGMLGINTTSFLAIFASAGLAIGMALSGTLQNFAGGVMILTLRPYRIGDFIEAQGYTGTVKEISLFSTLLNTVDNKTVIIPNGPLSTGIINNYSKEETRRVDWTFGVAYGSDYQKVRKVILEVINESEFVLKDPAVFVGLGVLNSSSVDITVRAWVKSADYWDLHFSINEEIYRRFNAEGIEFPFPQMDVHVTNK